MPDLRHIPAIRQVNVYTEKLYEALLPLIASDNGAVMERSVAYHLKAEIQSFIGQVLHANEKAIDDTEQIFATLPGICANLRTDAELILQFDPAAYSLEEVIITYPGFMAITIYRIAHELYQLKIPIIPRMMAEWAHSRTGIDINPGATIGRPFFIDHGTGVVIGETTVIGNNVKLYQGVTLGALSVRKDEASKKRHPTIEDDVTIYANSTILGGNTIIGNNSIIGGNTFITESIPAYSVVYHQQQQIVSDRREVKEVLNWVI